MTDPYVEAHALREPDAGDAELAVSFVTGEQFVANPVPQAEPIAVDAEGNTVLPAAGLGLVYGNGGAGKTTLLLDAAMHLAAGVPWLGGIVTPTRPLRVGWIEDEGPQEEFRRKLERKLGTWRERVPEDRFLILNRPWGAFDLRLDHHRDFLARTIAYALDLVILGPLNRLGMEGGGTPDDVRAFVRHLEDVQKRAGRPVCLTVLHHENRAGQISGAWEGIPDLLVHVVARGHGHTSVTWQKSKWSSPLHGTTDKLGWLDGEGFELEAPEPDRPERTWDGIEQYVIEHPGSAWNAVEAAVKGTNSYKRRRRDQMLAEKGVILNTGKGQAFELWHRDDPEHPTLELTAPNERHGDGADDRAAVRRGDGAVSADKEGTGEPTTAPAPPMYIGGAVVGTCPPPPEDEDAGAAPEHLNRAADSAALGTDEEEADW